MLGDKHDGDSRPSPLPVVRIRRKNILGTSLGGALGEKSSRTGGLERRNFTRMLSNGVTQ